VKVIIKQFPDVPINLDSLASLSLNCIPIWTILVRIWQDKIGDNLYGVESKFISLSREH
jgi:hypothetical protein